MLQNLLCAVSTALAVVLPIVALIAGIVLGAVIYMLLKKKKLGDTNKSANKITEEA